MELIVFTKHFTGRSIEGLIKDIKYVGAEGADLCVRPGYPVEPDTILETLPSAAKRFQEAGLSIPIITTPGDFIDPEKPIAEKVFGACAQAGVGLIKLGYWMMGDEGYWKSVENARRDLEGFSRLAKKYGVKACIHNHCGGDIGTMSLNSCSVMNLVKGLDPKYTGIFIDPAHLSISGEPLPMAFDIVKEYLSIVAVKDFVREQVIKDGKRRWQLRVIPVGTGYVDWPTAVKLLMEMKFNGPVSIHAEYNELDVDDIVDQVKMDIRFFRKLVTETQSQSKVNK